MQYAEYAVKGLGREGGQNVLWVGNANCCNPTIHCLFFFKGIVHQKKLILSSFTHLCVFTNLSFFLQKNTIEDIKTIFGNQTVSVLVDL